MEPTGCNKTTTQQNYFQNCTKRKTFVLIDPYTYPGLVSTSYYPNSLLLSPTCKPTGPCCPDPPPLPWEMD